ncbi:MAG: acetyl-CoA acyltransferase [Solirubrobacteraceae bacterium]
MEDVVIVEAVRTGIGRGDPTRGQYRDMHANDLLGACFQAVLARSGVSADLVEDVIAGCVLPYGEQSSNVARNAWLQAGLPETVPATTVDRQCGSGQQAVNFAAALIASGHADIVVAGGVEHMSGVPFAAEEASRERFGTPWPERLLDRHELVPQGISAERVAERWGITREELDDVSLRSHRRAAAAWADGRFAAEVVPVMVGGEPMTVDQGIRPDTSVEALARLRPVFMADGRVTAGNSSQISDGAAALLLASREVAERLGLPVRARIVDHVSVGVDPVLMLTGPVPATERILGRNRLSFGEVDRYEVNEAFAAVLCMWEREIRADPETVNVNGGAIALGHPLGASGARLLTSLVHELQRAEARHGIVTMCCRGGLGIATLLERMDA